MNQYTLYIEIHNIVFDTALEGCWMGYKLPREFYFGFSTAGFQHEMGMPGSEYMSDWYIWVHDLENIMAGIVSGDLPENGPGYWELYQVDHDIAQRIGMNTARIGIEWARIFPEPTVDINVDIDEDDEGIKRVILDEKHLAELDERADKKAVERYRQILSDLRERGFTIILNLYHWPLPLWVHDPIAVRKQGVDKAPAGWVDKRTIIEFTKYTGYISWKLGDLVDMWSTMNEPNVVWTTGYLLVKTGFPPGYLDQKSALIARKNLLEAHARAYDVVKEFSKKPVGVIYSIPDIQPLKDDDKDAVMLYEQSNVYYFFDALVKGVFDDTTRDDLKGRLDWVGINYYSRVVITKRYVSGDRYIPFVVPGYGHNCSPNGRSLDNRPTSDLGWEIYPEGLYNVLVEIWRRYGLPIIITKNGIADERDQWRSWFLVSHIYQAYRALSDGVALKGYLHWNLIDNYEWSSGFKMRFGLVYVDYQTKKRYLRPSAFVFREIASRKEIPNELEHLVNPPTL
ncbi:MAG: beta-galactosidase BgaS [Desulfurococcaceae archaeon]